MAGLCSFNAARGFVGGATKMNAKIELELDEVSMPHAALWVVQHERYSTSYDLEKVSMPHAALWVVQLTFIT